MTRPLAASTSFEAQPVHGYAQVANGDERYRLKPSAKNRCKNKNCNQKTDRKQRRIEIVLFYQCSVLLLNHCAPPSSTMKIQGLCLVYRRLERKVYAQGPEIFGQRFRLWVAASGIWPDGPGGSKSVCLTRRRARSLGDASAVRNGTTSSNSDTRSGKDSDD